MHTPRAARRSPAAPLLLAVLTACGADAGVPSLTATVDGVEVTCRSETRLPTAEACGQWGSELLELEPGATRVVITLHPLPGPCEVDLYRGNDVSRSVQDIECR